MLVIVRSNQFVARHPVISALIVVGSAGLLLIAGVGLKDQFDSANPVIIEVVFPDDFKGLAAVRYSVRQGEFIEPHNRKVTYRIPPSGEIKVRGESPQTQWHVVVARRDSGKQLPVGDSTDVNQQFGADQMVVWPLALEGYDAGFFVGTTAALKQLPKTLK